MNDEERLEQIKAKSSWQTSHDEREEDNKWLVEQVESLKVQVKHNFEAFYDKREENKSFRKALEELSEKGKKMKLNASIARGIVKLGSLDAGSLFIYKDTIALKSEYKTDQGAWECHIVGSGEMFWGGVNTAEELNQLYVAPILLSK